MIGLIDTAMVYTEHPTTGDMSVIAATALACRLAHVNARPAATSFDRAELAAIRNLIWANYFMPETAQVEVDGIRWNVVSGTFGSYRGPSGAEIYKRCDVRRAA